jgi:protein TonB
LASGGALSDGARRALRYLLAAATALLMALAMAWFMYFLTSATKMHLANSDRIQMLDFVRLKRNETTERKDRKPERPEVNEVPEAPPLDNSSRAGGETLAVAAPSFDGTGLSLGRGGIGLGTGDGEYLPIVKVAPVYPRSAAARGITGECLVRYTVTTAGTVRDVEVIRDACTDMSFYRPSVDAALRFKYKPRVIDGTPVEVKDVYNRFYYELDDSGGDSFR